LIVLPLTKDEERRRYAETLGRFIDDVFGRQVEDLVLVVDFAREDVKPEEVDEFQRLSQRDKERVSRALAWRRFAGYGLYFPEHRVIVVQVREEPYWSFIYATTTFHESVHHVLLKDGNRLLDRLVDEFAARGIIDESLELISVLERRGMVGPRNVFLSYLKGFINEYVAYTSMVMFMILLLSEYRAEESETVAAIALRLSLSSEVDDVKDRLDLIRGDLREAPGATERELELVDEVKKEIESLPRSRAAQSWTFRFVKEQMKNTPSRIAHRYPEIFKDRQPYISQLRRIV